MKQVLKDIKNSILKIRNYLPLKKEKCLYIVASANSRNSEKYAEIVRRLQYFDPKLEIREIESPSFSQYFNFDLIGVLDAKANSNQVRILKFLKNDQAFNFDYDVNYMDGWDFHRLLSAIYDGELNAAIAKGKELFEKQVDKLQRFKRVYLFGTGPSLQKAIGRDWNDGVRVVCNTIVKDPELWHHVNPHFIVAGDAIYHFGISSFAQNFIKDLRTRLEESPSVYLVIPALFYHFCARELGNELSHRIIPIPIHGGTKTNIHLSFKADYTLPSLGNVLPLLLLPMGCNISKNVCLWGFDGRAPGDQMFWKNSTKHFYGDKVDEMTRLHPAFYKTLIPQNKESSYVANVHGDVLENALNNAERAGFGFSLLHFSHTETLMKRYEEPA